MFWGLQSIARVDLGKRPLEAALQEAIQNNHKASRARCASPLRNSVESVVSTKVNRQRRNTVVQAVST